MHTLICDSIPDVVTPLYSRFSLRHVVLPVAVAVLAGFLNVIAGSNTASAQDRRIVDLNFENAVEIAIDNSYRVRQLKLGVERSRSWLRSRQAGLRSQASVNLSVPEIRAISDNKWNSQLNRYELVRENTRRWQAQFSVRQPVILFGYPTNGYLSLNNTVYRYAQLTEGLDVNYYNRYFIKFSQPFFQPNELKNDLEQARLDLRQEELEFRQDVADMIDDIAEDYYELFELAYQQQIYRNHVRNLERAYRAAQESARQDTNRTIESNQIQVELANAREQLNQSMSDFRLESSEMKQRLRLSQGDSVFVNPRPRVNPINVDMEQAIEYGYNLRPRLQELQIRERQRELNLENARGWNSFRVELEATYGRESRDPRIRQVWNEPRNSYSVGVNMRVPIWDWGRHKHQLQAQQLSVRQMELYIDEAREEIQSDIRNAIQNLEEYEQRALTMRENRKMAQSLSNVSIRRYRNDEISALDVLQSFNRQKETASNFLDAYLGYRQALITLMRYTHYDFENRMPLFERFHMEEISQSEQIVSRTSEPASNDADAFDLPMFD